jgi:Xaa-Pro dipeptidase
MVKQRLAGVQEHMRAHDVDYLALLPGHNMTYLTGHEFMLLERAFIAFFPADESNDVVLVIPALEYPAWEREVPYQTRPFRWTDEQGPDPAMKQAAALLSGAGVIAAEQLRMRLQEYQLIARHLPDAAFVSAEEIISPVRMIKDTAEIESLREAVEIAEGALQRVLPHVEPGMAEREICNRLTGEMLLGGGGTTALEPLVLSGSASGMPHGRTGRRVIETGDILLFDFGTRVNGYRSDITRTFVVGAAPDHRVREVYEAVRAANVAGRAAIRPGATCQDVDRATRKVIEEAGYGEYFTHRTGHGLGLDVHEEPGIVEGNNTPLEEGMTFTVEPGIYIDGWGGVRIEDNVVVTVEGCESLSTLDRGLRVIGQGA